jgi:hypothetical protein
MKKKKKIKNIKYKNIIMKKRKLKKNKNKSLKKELSLREAGPINLPGIDQEKVDGENKENKAGKNGRR